MVASIVFVLLNKMSAQLELSCVGIALTAEANGPEATRITEGTDVLKLSS